MFKTNEEGMKKLRDIIEDVKTCMFTTTDEECNVFSRPMLTIKVDNELNLWFFSNEDSEKIKEISPNRQVTLVYAHPGKSTYMNVYGRPAVVHDKEKMKELWTPALRSWFPEGIEDPALCLVQVTVDEAVSWDNATNGMVPLVEPAIHNTYQTADTADIFNPQTANW